ncbi:MAG: nicotinate-nucleotide--dimethylbenzimidazole phosphoribosyltransferase [Pseudobdellovibrionaceae bacterium]|jgi:nicotinate-nucleotide--dimethylbenzimidazole phosphoribosyltransferase|nr:nicotinate-nucleotide--dimethylbenzimidazole phosphoribosyltransferase [Pseudobdellovibrionaceae bacterium]
MSQVAAQAEADLKEIRNLIDSIGNIYSSPSNFKQKSVIYDWLSPFSSTSGQMLQSPRLSIFGGAYRLVDSTETDSQNFHEYVNNFVTECNKGTLKLNQLCNHANCDLRVYEMTPSHPITYTTTESSFNIEEMIRALAYGLICVEQGTDFLAISSFGVSCETVASAIINAHSTQNDRANDVANLNLERLLKINAAKKGFDCLLAIGGPEIAAMCGVILAARLAGIPVLLEGMGALAALTILSEYSEFIGQHCAITGQIAEHIVQNFSEPFIPAPYNLITAQGNEPLCGISAACLIPQFKNDLLLEKIMGKNA